MKYVLVLVLCHFTSPFIAAQHVACLGRIEPGERMIHVAAPPHAIVDELRVQRGDAIEAGTVIALLREAPVYQARLERARQQFARAEAELDRIQTGERPEIVAAQEALITAQKAEALLLEFRRERYGALLKENHIDQDRYDEIVSQHQALQARIQREISVLDSLRSGRVEDVRMAEIDVHLARAQVVEAKALFALQQVRAPITGTVLDIHAWPGESVGDEGALISLGDTATMTVLAEVYESDLPRVRVGQRATFRGHAFEGEKGGYVAEIQAFFEQSRIFPLDPAAYADRRVVTVRIQPDHPDLLTTLSRAHVVITIQAP